MKELVPYVIVFLMFLGVAFLGIYIANLKPAKR
jgi:hypothetical protein